MTTRPARASFLALLLVPLAAALTACATVEARDAKTPPPVQDERSADELAAAADDDPRRRLDFWVGEWVVTDAEGKTLGTNSITKRENGHLILEEWTGAGGGTGTSMNYWDREAERWKQVWVSANGTVLQMAGTFADGAMRLEGVTLYPDGRSVPHKTTLTPLDDGRVRQLIEESKDDGATWHQAFEGFYAPRELARRATPPPPGAGGSKRTAARR